MAKELRIECLALLLSLLLLALSATGFAHFTMSTTALTINASPSVLSTVVTNENGLELLVLWRGTTGWFLSAGHRTEHYGGGNGQVTLALHYARVKLDLSFQPATRAARLQGKSLVLPPDVNVLLIDGVDSAAGPTLSQAIVLDGRKDNVDPRRGTIAPLFRRSAEIVSFLRCGDRLTDGLLLNNPDARQARAAGVSTEMMNHMLEGMCDELKPR